MNKEEALMLLVNQKTLSQKQADELQSLPASGNIATFLVQNGVSKKAVLEILHTYYKVPSFDMQGVSFDPELLVLFDRDILDSSCFIPIKTEGDILFVIAADPTNQAMKKEIEESQFKSASFSVGIENDILNAINSFYPEEEEGDDEQEQQEEKEDDN